MRSSIYLGSTDLGLQLSTLTHLSASVCASALSAASRFVVLFIVMEAAPLAEVHKMGTRLISHTTSIKPSTSHNLQAPIVARRQSVRCVEPSGHRSPISVF
ncbi:hypothetical protein SCP_0507590 [Sparassis crispa]|uniref:Uncharacterized protein n=1 Tax=Sparassis crispa TaxID=139825 RepID=A0A401GNB2_9APHY|nr:hypothetical protein SCP_0507590 [Sparassis crispa]GBE83703.1 hypothetical protein SCP_0507590 [Sparassis crispa]